MTDQRIPSHAQRLLRQLKGVRRRSANEWMALSPIRQESKPSLHITLEKDGRLLLFDHGGGDIEDILDAIGLRTRDLFPGGERVQFNPHQEIKRVDSIWKKPARGSDAMLGWLSADLMLSPETPREFDVSFCTERRAFCIPETDAGGKCIGVQYRKLDGTKSFRKGGKRGLVGLHTLTGRGRLHICEGATDAWTLRDWEYDNVLGRPSATTGTDLVLEVIRKGTYSYAIVIADPKPQERRGAEQLRDAIKRFIPATVVTPPGGHDLRDWYRSGATKTDVQKLIASVSPEMRFRAMTFDDLKRVPKPPFHIDNLFPVGATVVLYGDARAGKSFIALDWALSIQTGTDWTGGERNTQNSGQVVYIAAEGGFGMGPRIRAWEATHRHSKAMARRPYAILDPPNMINDDDVDALIRQLNLLSMKPVFVVIDTLAKTMVGGDDNSARDISLYIRSAERLRTALNCTVVIVHHTNKSGGFRGSSVIDQGVDVVIKSTRQRDERDGRPLPNITLRCEKQKDASEFDPIPLLLSPVQIGYDEWSCWIEPGTLDDNSSSESKIRPGAIHALTVLRQLEARSGAPVSRQAWMAAAGISSASFTRYAAELSEAGVVERIEKGRQATFRTIPSNDSDQEVISVSDQ